MSMKTKVIIGIIFIVIISLVIILSICEGTAHIPSIVEGIPTSVPRP